MWEQRKEEDIPSSQTQRHTNGDYNKLRKMCFKIFLSKKSLVKLNVTSPDGLKKIFPSKKSHVMLNVTSPKRRVSKIFLSKKVTCHGLVT